MRALTFALALALALTTNSAVRAQALVDGAPYSPLVREHYYAQLAKSPWRALGYELLLPGAGSAHVGLRPHAAATLALSLAGASLWIAGALRDRPALMWSGIGVFGGARAYGLVSAPISAVLLNRAFRSQLGITTAD